VQHFAVYFSVKEPPTLSVHSCVQGLKSTLPTNVLLKFLSITANNTLKINCGNEPYTDEYALLTVVY
jgi:hypothetical protein